MAKFVKLDPQKLTALRSIDERLVSYNVEMTEVTGGTFWKAYTPEQIAGTEKFPGASLSYTYILSSQSSTKKIPCRR